MDLSFAVGLQGRTACKAAPIERGRRGMRPAWHDPLLAGAHSSVIVCQCPLPGLLSPLEMVLQPCMQAM